MHSPQPQDAARRITRKTAIRKEIHAQICAAGCLEQMRSARIQPQHRLAQRKPGTAGARYCIRRRRSDVYLPGVYKAVEQKQPTHLQRILRLRFNFA